METCDVCEKPAFLTCSYCQEAVYCSEECQKKDYDEHITYECFHPDDMSDDHVADEVQLHLEFGAEPIQYGLNQRDWLISLIGTRESRLRRKRRRRARRTRKKRRQARKARRKGKVAKWQAGAARRGAEGARREAEATRDLREAKGEQREAERERSYERREEFRAGLE